MRTDHPELISSIFALLGCCHAEMGQKEEAIQFFDQAASHPQVNPQVLGLRAIFHAERGNPLTANQECDNVLEKTLDPHVLNARARIFLKQGRIRDAMGDLGCVSSSELASTFYLKALLHQKMDHLEQAIDSLRRATSKSPDDAYWILSREISLSPEDPDPYFLRGLYLWERKDYEDACRDLDSVLHLRKNDWKALIFKAHCKQELGDSASSSLCLAKAFRADPEGRKILKTLNDFIKNYPHLPDFYKLIDLIHSHLGLQK